jgi:Flp pilus assembly secretin CpaC
MTQDLAMLRKELARSQFPDVTADTRMARDGQTILVLRGTVYSDVQKERVIQIAGKFFNEDQIVDQLQIKHPQVEIDIESYSIDLDKAREVGDNVWNQIATLTSVNGWKFLTGPGQNPRTVAYPEVTIMEDVRTGLVANNTNGVVTNSSKQHLSARAGKDATVDNAEDRYVKIEGALNAELVQVTTGQRLTITPNILEDGKFETQVKVEVSEFTQEAQGGADVAVSVARRELESLFVSGQGETVVLGGTKFMSTNNLGDTTPYLSRVPVLNMFFYASTKRSKEVLQVYLMTLFAPSMFPAEEDAMSRSAMDAKGTVIINRDDLRSVIEKKQSWEAPQSPWESFQD